MNYLYDETFEGFLTCVYNHYYFNRAIGIFPERDYQVDLLNDYEVVITDEEKASIVYNAISDKISHYDLGRVYKVFRTCEKEKEIKLLRYIIMGFKKGSKIRFLHGHPIVADVLNAERRLGLEIQRLYGLIRFSSVSDGANSVPIMYASIEPDNDLLEFLASHFIDRFKNEPFIIHDVTREKALVAYRKEWTISEFHDSELLSNTREEEEYQNLWRRYFDIIAIKERKNSRLQKNYMPARYWKHLTEITADKS